MSVRAAGAPAAGAQRPKPQCRVSIGAPPVRANRRLDEVLAIGFANMRLHPCADTAVNGKQDANEGGEQDIFHGLDLYNPRQNPSEFDALLNSAMDGMPMNEGIPTIPQPADDPATAQEDYDKLLVDDSEPAVLMQDVGPMEGGHDLVGFPGSDPPPKPAAPGPSTSKYAKPQQYSPRQKEILNALYAAGNHIPSLEELQPSLEQLNSVPNERSVTRQDVVQYFRNKKRATRRQQGLVLNPAMDGMPMNEGSPTIPQPADDPATAQEDYDKLLVDDSEPAVLMQDVGPMEGGHDLVGFPGSDPPPKPAAPGPSTSKYAKPQQYSPRQKEILNALYAAGNHIPSLEELQPSLEQLNSVPNERNVTRQDVVQFFQNKRRPDRVEKTLRRQQGLVNYNGVYVTLEQRDQLRCLQKNLWKCRAELNKTTLQEMQGAKEVLEEQYKKIGSELSSSQTNDVIQALEQATGTTFQKNDVQAWWKARKKFQNAVKTLDQYKEKNNLEELPTDRNAIL